LKGFTKANPKHIIVDLEPQIVAAIDGRTIYVDGTAFDGVLIELRGPGPVDRIRATHTDKSGRFRSGRLPAGQYKLKTTMRGFQSVTCDITIKRGAKSLPIEIPIPFGV
jgi:hypothetical protein